MLFLTRKYTFHFKRSKCVPVKGVDDKRQIAATFSVSAVGEFLPMQTIYWGKTKQSLPKFNFPKLFSVSLMENHWSNTSKFEFFMDIVFPYFQIYPKRTEFFGNNGYIQDSG